MSDQQNLANAATSDELHSVDELAQYDYALPEDLIAQQPLPERDASRLLIVHRHQAGVEHSHIRQLADWLRPGDCLVLNDTRVLPARLIGERIGTGGKWDGLYLGSNDAGDWRLIGHTRGTLRSGDVIRLIPLGHGECESRDDKNLRLSFIGREPDGVWLMRPNLADDPVTLLQHFGTMPLPPYMQRKIAGDSDWDRYQTTYATHPGSVAAPTAGLHLTDPLLADLQQRGVSVARVTLHVGLGTFRPISVERLSEHHMHSEWCEITESAVAQICEAKQRGGRIVAVGTTSVRTLETASVNGQLQPYRGETALFIRPPFEFRTVDALLTNFHLPRSTLLVLVSTFAGREFIRSAYETAIRERYRFYSYGDAMLIFP